MPGALSYVRESLAGALLAMLGRPEGLNRLDLSLAGFWRSFAALILVLPLAFIIDWSVADLTVREGEFPAAPDESLLGSSVLWLTDWIAFPLLFALLVRPLGLSDRYVPFIVAWNWSAVVLTLINALAALPYGLGLASAEVATFLLIVATGVSFFLAYRVARVALAVSAMTGTLVVLLDFCLSLVIGLSLKPVV